MIVFSAVIILLLGIGLIVSFIAAVSQRISFFTLLQSQLVQFTGMLELYLIDQYKDSFHESHVCIKSIASFFNLHLSLELFVSWSYTLVHHLASDETLKLSNTDDHHFTG
jgi:hypothetical protein